MSDLWIDVQEMLESGATPEYIAEVLCVPYEWVEVVAAAEGIAIMQDKIGAQDSSGESSKAGLLLSRFLSAVSFEEPLLISIALYMSLIFVFPYKSA